LSESAGEPYLSEMKKISENQIREEVRRGKNEPMAKDAKVDTTQNGEREPTRESARKQPGTDQSSGR
jgi:hypothetical protein